jgi:hypothetical protein
MLRRTLSKLSERSRKPAFVGAAGPPAPSVLWAVRSTRLPKIQPSSPVLRTRTPYQLPSWRSSISWSPWPSWVRTLSLSEGPAQVRLVGGHLVEVAGGGHRRGGEAAEQGGGEEVAVHGKALT